LTAAHEAGEALAEWLGEADTIGTAATTFHRDDQWGVSSQAYEYTADDMIITYSIHRVEPFDVPLRVFLLGTTTVHESGDGGWWGEYPGEVFTYTRASDRFDGGFYQETIRRIPATGTWSMADGEELNHDAAYQLLDTSSAGPFVYVEVEMWDEDNPWTGVDDHDMLGITSHTYYNPSETTFPQHYERRVGGKGEGDVTIKWDIGPPR
jgi:hypothetical protein